MKKIIFIIMILLFCGCKNSDYKELNDIAIVSGISIDIKGDNYLIGALIANSNKKDHNILYKASGPSIAEAIKKLESITPKQIYLGHLGVIIVSNDTAKKGLDRISDFFYRNPETTKRFYLVMSDNALDVLKIISPLESYPFQSIKLNIENASNSNHKTNSLTYTKFIEALITKGKEPYIPVIKIVNNEKDETLVKQYIELDNIALFKKSKFIGYADKDESRGINLLLGNTKDMLITTKCGSTDISNIKVNKKIINDYIIFNIKGMTNINEKYCEIKEEDIKKRINYLIEKGMNRLHELDTDTIGLSSYMYKYNKNIKFKDIKTKYNIDIKLRNGVTVHEIQ